MCPPVLTGSASAVSHTATSSPLRWVLTVFVVVALAWPQMAAAIDPGRHLNRLIYRSWQKEDGLPQSSVNAIVQDGDGYLWIGTFGGLARFDGVRFETVSLAGVVQFGAFRVLSLLYTGDHTLWVGLQDGSLIARRNGRFDRVHGFDSESILSLAETPGGDVLIGTSRRAYLWDGQTPTPLGSPRGRTRGYLNAVLPGGGGSALAGTVAGLFTVSKSLEVPVKGVASQVFVRCLVRTRGNAVLVGTSQGLLRIDPDGGTAWIDRRFDVKSVLVDRHGAVWVGTVHQGLWRFDEGRWERVPSSSGLTATEITCLFEDREGNIWAGTARFGLHELVEGPVIPYGGTGSPLDRSITAVAGDHDHVWAALGCDGVVRIGLDGRERVVLFGSGHQKEHLCIQSLLPATGGGLILGVWQRDAVFRFRDGQIETFARLPEGSVVTRAMLRVPDGRILLGTGSGLMWLDHGSVRRIPNTRGIPVFTLVRRSDGTILAGTNQGILELTGNAQVRTLVAGEDLQFHPVRAISEEPQTNGLWIGTYGGGVFHWRNGHTVPVGVQAGLPDSTVSAIVPDRFGNLWLTGNDGVIRVEKSLLLRIVAGGKGPVHFRRYTSRDGLPDTECNGGGTESAWLAPDDSLWVPTLRGVARIETHSARAASRTRPVIEGARLGGKPIPLEALAHLPPDATNLEIDFTAIWFKSPLDVEFRYRLEGYDNTWSFPLGRRVAYYSRLPAGKRRFRLQARIEAGPWVEALQEPIVNRRARFTESAWFPVSIAVGSSGMIALLFLLRLRAARRRERYLEVLIQRRAEERERLAALVARVNEGRSLKEVLDHLWEACDGLIPFERMAYATVESGWVRAEWVRTRYEPVLLNTGTRVQLENTSLKELAKSGSVRIIGDLEEYFSRHPASRLTGLLVEEGLRSSLLVPLRAFGDPVGFLFFNSTHTNAYTNDHERILRTIGGQISVIIEKSRLAVELAEQASTDPLTGLANRRTFERHLEDEWRRAFERNESLAILLLDIDHFKLFNDRYGHLEGDACLVKVGRLTGVLGQRSADLAARWGGEEFAIVLYNVSLASAADMAEKLRTQVLEMAIPNQDSPVSRYVTISIGLAVGMPRAGGSPEELFAAADAALYSAKQEGRNRVEATDSPDTSSDSGDDSCEP